jgi:hypothetical protein
VKIAVGGQGTHPVGSNGDSQQTGASDLPKAEEPRHDDGGVSDVKNA